jgi:hypothetical protein
MPKLNKWLTITMEKWTKSLLRLTALGVTTTRQIPSFFEESRNKRINAAAALRIVVLTLYQDTIDLFLSKLEKKNN